MLGVAAQDISPARASAPDECSSTQYNASEVTAFSGMPFVVTKSCDLSPLSSLPPFFIVHECFVPGAWLSLLYPLPPPSSPSSLLSLWVQMCVRSNHCNVILITTAFTKFITPSRERNASLNFSLLLEWKGWECVVIIYCSKVVIYCGNGGNVLP